MTLPILAMHLTDRCRCTLGYFLCDCLNSIGFCVIDIIPSVTSHNECKKNYISHQPASFISDALCSGFMLLAHVFLSQSKELIVNH